jgi:gas vesicle protein
METRKFSSGSFFKGIAIGGILASAVVLFTAPHSGADTRQMLQEKAVLLRDRSVKTLEDVRQRMDTIVSDTLDRTDLVAQRLGRQLDVISDQGQVVAESNQPGA